MKSLLQIIGGIWAALGVWYLVILVGEDPADLTLGIGVVFAMIVAILPGLAVAGIGSAIGSRNKSNG